MVKLNKNEILMFFGDSITDGARSRLMDGNDMIGHGYVSIISSKLGLDNIENSPKFINKGISGNTISEMYARLNGDVLQNKPNIISILAGINDIGKGVGLPYGMVTDNYIKIYQMMLDDIRITLDNPKIIICEPFYLEIDGCDNMFKNTPYVECEAPIDINVIKRRKEQYKNCRKEITYMQKMLEEFAKENNCIYVPLQEEIFKAAEKTSPEYIVWDSIHPTIVGHEIIARKWLEVVEKSM